MSRRWVSLVLALVALPASGACLDPDDRWIRVETANFSIVSNASDEFASEIGLELETLRQVLARLQPDTPFNSPRPTTIYLFKNDASFEPFKHRHRGEAANVQAFFMPGEDANLVGVGAARGRHTAHAAFHEYVHFVMHNNMPHIPTWLSEGLAEYYSTFEIDGDSVVFGKPIMPHLQELAVSKALAMGTLLTVTSRSSVYNEEKRQGVFYAQSWLAVHYIYGAHPELIPKLDDFIDRSRRPEPLRTVKPATSSLDRSMRDFMKSVRQGDQAVVGTFREAFGFDVAELGRRLDAYGNRQTFPRQTMSIDQLDVDTKTSVTELAPHEALSFLGDFLILSRDSEPQLAGECFEQAAALEPKYGAAHRGLGLVAESKAEYDVAVRAFRKALELDPADVIAMKHLAVRLLRRAIEGNTIVDADAVEEASGLLGRAIELTPGWAELRAIYGATLLIQHACDPGIDVLRAASEALPSRLDVLQSRVTLLASCDRAGEARAILEQQRNRGVTRDMLPAAYHAVAQAEWAAVMALMDEGRHDEAEAELLRLIDSTPEPELRRPFEDNLEWLRRNIADKRLLDRFNEGVALANSGRLPDAAKIFREVADASPDSDLATTAKQYLEQMGPHLD